MLYLCSFVFIFFFFVAICFWWEQFGRRWSNFRGRPFLKLWTNPQWVRGGRRPRRWGRGRWSLTPRTASWHGSTLPLPRKQLPTERKPFTIPRPLPSRREWLTFQWSFGYLSCRVYYPAHWLPAEQRFAPAPSFGGRRPTSTVSGLRLNGLPCE